MAGKGRGIQVAYNGVCWGGETGAGVQMSRQQVDGHDWRLSYEDATFRSRFVVAALPWASKPTELSALDALRVPDGNLGVAVGKRVEFANLSVNGTAVADAAVGGKFASTDVGMPLSTALGTAQIVSVTDANNVVVATSLGTGSTQAGYLGYTLLRIVPSLYVGGFALRTQLAFPADERCTGRSFVADFSARWLRDTSATRNVAGAGRWPNAQVSTTYDASGFARVVFAGRYVADSAPTTALERYAAQFDTWRDAVKSYLSITNWERDDRASSERWDETQTTCDFVATYQELSRPKQTGVSYDDANLKRVTVSLARVGQYTTGRSSSEKGPVYCRATWSCAFDGAQKTYAQIAAYYTSTVRPYALAEVRREFGGTVVVLNEVANTVTGDGGLAVRGELLALLVGVGGNYLTYEKSCRYLTQKNWFRRKILDGQRGTFVRFSAGETDHCTVLVRGEKVGEESYFEATPDLLAPPAASGSPSGRWVADDDAWTRSKRWVGKAPEGGAVRALVTFVAYQRYTWEAEGTLEPPRWAEGPTGGRGQGGTGSVGGD